MDYKQIDKISFKDHPQHELSQAQTCSDLQSVVTIL